ncbi:MAG: 4Fe-4S binding protein [Desulfurococcaceae archaeon]
MRVFVEVDYGKCNTCKLCVEYCPAFVFTLEENRVVVANGDKCVECYGCVPLCPQGAISVRIVNESSGSLFSFFKKPGTRGG